MANYATHRKARFDYEILETIEAGIELFGHEVKSIRNGLVSIEGGYVVVRGGEAYLVNIDIKPYQPKNTPEDYESMRNRRLLLSKKEIAQLTTATDKDGMAAIPLSIYGKGRVIKIEIGIGKGKKKADKRQKIKERESDIEIERLMKR